ncbi:Transcriptional regulator, contains XRE-family HTH domain [Glycomyces sambucus]|uniref:Transcriptional regulator, contains XRE-family HTH domain n=1 Tax=Glycomyces sambucus TaxID=380244 RepID=A0A1G9M529_9ACTN|nr:Scr1 family TA system antitoxin-like transcriptional regulator [Glycomyces sambucus]SDL69041.1 Transcriptional regulator, contains XRE-family HTH domain [Glycomyces sambucus]
MIRLKLMRWLVAILMQDAREATGMSQKKVARAFRVSPGTIYNWERGIHHPPYGMIARIAEVYGIDAELRFYIELILEANDFRILEAQPRLHAIALAKAEQNAEFIFKHEPHLIHGPLQTRDYHFLVPQAAEQLPDSEAEDGWNFKRGRREGLRARTPAPQVRYLSGDSAIYHLRSLPEPVRIEIVRDMLGQDSLPNVEIRVINQFHHARSTSFDVYRGGIRELSLPPFIYTESFPNRSWCIEEERLVSLYHEAGQAMWQLGIPLKEFLHEHCRDLLA